MSALPMIDRAAVNRANPQHSTGPQTLEGKARSSQKTPAATTSPAAPPSSNPKVTPRTSNIAGSSSTSTNPAPSIIPAPTRPANSSEPCWPENNLMSYAPAA